MKKLIIGFILGALVFSVLPIYAATQAINVTYKNIKLSVRGQTISTDAEPFVYENRTFVPVRFVAEALNMDVKYNEETDTVEITDKVSAIPIPTPIPVSNTSINESPKVDNIDYPFSDDENLLGKWEYISFIKNIDDFNPLYPHVLKEEDRYIKAMEFKPNGEVGLATTLPNAFQYKYTWTNGYIINHDETTCASYVIKNINSVDYLFFEWKSGDYTLRGMTPWYYVLKRISN